MKTPVDVVKGKIVSVDEHGNVVIHAHYDDWRTLTRRKYGECYVEMIDSRPVSEKQRRMCWALLGEIAEWQGQSRSAAAKDMANLARKVDFLINELGENAERLFSLSNAPMSLVCAYQRYLVRFVVENDIPTAFPLLQYVDDVTDYVYACLISKKCCVCGRGAELHHVERVGMGRSRKEICHLGMEALPLCRGHHQEAHGMPDGEFFEKYHLAGGIEIDRTIGRIYRLNTRGGRDAE